MRYEYKCVAGPMAIRIKKDAPLNDAMETFAVLLNAGAKKGWELHSIETITLNIVGDSMEPLGCQNWHMLIFKRPVNESDIE